MRLTVATSWPARLLAFVRLGRPLFLAGGFVMHGAGVAAALYSGARLNVMALLWGQVAITATQLMVHYANDYFDLAADRANRTPTAWSGGSRVLPDGELPPRVALYTSLALAVAAAGATLVLGLSVRPAPLTLPLLGLALVLSWGYSAPPFRLHARGFGQLTATLVVAGLTPLLGFYLQAGRLASLPLLAVVPLCCLQFAMLLAVDIPDAAGDRAAGKRTLVVQIGQAQARAAVRPGAGGGVWQLAAACGRRPAVHW